MAIIAKGELVESGTIDDIRARAGTKTEVIVTIDDSPGAIQVLQAAKFAVSPRPKPGEIAVNCDPSFASTITKTLADSGRYLHGLRVEQATLEDAFLNLTGGPPPPPPPGGQVALSPEEN